MKRSLAEIRKIAGSGDNLVPAVLDAVKSYTTLGEICTVLKDVFGEYKSVERL